ncbi:MAG: hypothetical protein AAF918_02585 [Pseudomonadota bacterium]
MTKQANKATNVHDNAEARIPADEIAEPNMGKPARAAAATRSIIIGALLLVALGVAGAFYLDRSKGTLHDEEGIVGD